MKLWALASLASLAAAANKTAPSSLDINDPDSIKDVAASIAYDAMTYYNGNTSTVPKDLGDLQDPYYWWVAGALWGVMLDYYHFTGDPSYNDVIIQALLAPTNLGPDHDYMPPEHADEEGNDDLFFWGSAVLSAAERNFPQPNTTLPSWLDISANVFNELVGRWNMSACNGGLLWQIFPENPNGLTYKNSVSNGGFFQLAARLARATGNSTYLDWANKVWDWSWEVGFIDKRNYHVYDGASVLDNCEKTTYHSFTYTSGIYLYGAAVLANYTGKPEWEERSKRLLDGTDWFFSPFDNSTDIMYEAACETVNTCNWDMSTFKGYLSRFMYQSIQMQPSLKDHVERFLVPSAQAAAKTCTGGKSGRECGMRWWVGGFDGNPGLGQQMCALEIVQGLLLDDLPVPLQGDQIKVVRSTDWDKESKVKATPTPSPTNTEKPKPTESDDAASLARADLVLASFSIGTVLLLLGLA
ncbi:Mannan endo-1,6-alpha-mannosidase [Fusarium keratoplasticum]|uniref:Mannan endo-1,6-alpha-mannosidase n=1 Tax=Fusarium keratoplasticum TaxID=1328300 RepID=A0ACC0R9M6_9HYPO|nr:Mannan endo-1,6-alpha-mannosidase [Fusarium keratoplasticum]KAI8679979.1 Mannan endo-1,6-alpha-mannosidase [Fusarium keratoplasticum]KAI8686060.1 Mannan endo-1,6-alpha-mannosidase [Fusarium keratoplasticum]